MTMRLLLLLGERHSEEIRRKEGKGLLMVAMVMLVVLVSSLVGSSVCKDLRGSSELKAEEEYLMDDGGFRYHLWSVYRFGAVGDGQTDDTKAIQSTFDACVEVTMASRVHCVVQFPSNGTYLSFPVSIATNNTVVQIDGEVSICRRTTLSRS